jgi:hypothetical protein
LREIFVGLNHVHIEGETGKQVAFRGTLSNNHVI